jgi:hypothetical protein
MKTYQYILAALALASVAGQAGAVPTLRRVQPTFFQSGNGSLTAGLVVEASTDLPVLVIAGGFTITCTTSSLPQTAERRATYVGFFGPHETLTVPEVVPSTYSIPGWSSIPTNTCGAQCVMQYKGEAKDETSLSVRIGSAGIGASFALIPPGEQMSGNAVIANICRTGKPQCCTPKCSIF